MAGLAPFPFRLSISRYRHTSFSKTSLQLQQAAQNARSRRGASCLIHRRRSQPDQSTSPKPASRLQWQRRWTTSQAHSNVGGSRLKADTSPEIYQSPTTGILSYLPPSWVPYAELIRIDKPAGTLYLFMPCLFSTLLAAPLTDPITLPSTVLGTTALFLIGAVIMRGAGCTINDLWDRNLDPLVARTRLRPIARGAISVRQAIPFLGVQLLAGLGMLMQFPTECLYYGIPSLVLVGTYPLAKRVTQYPQVVLGLAFSWGAIMGFPALGIDLLADIPAFWSAVCLYASCVAWTVVYDMIYAYQDIKDDVVAGIKSIAIAQESRAKTFMRVIAFVQTALLCQAMLTVGAGYPSLAGCVGAYLSLNYMITKVNLKDPAECGGWFRKGVWLTGGIISTGLFGEYLVQYLGLTEKNHTAAKFGAKTQA